MSHDEAINDGATERYVLEEMTDEERDAFEEHYFECAVCAEDVRAAIAVREGLAAVQHHEPVPAVVPFEPRRWKLPATLATAASAAFALLGWTHYLQVVPLRAQLAQARQAAIPASHNFQPLRGENNFVFPDRSKAILLDVYIDTSDEAPGYVISVVNEQGVSRKIQVSPDQAKEGFVPVVFPAGTIEPGNYTIRVDGKQPAMETFRFQVK